MTKKDNVVVEGPEDVFYLQAFKYLVPDDQKPKQNFISGGGAGNMGTIGAILEGWGANVSYLYDNDKGFQDGTKELKNTWKVLPEGIKKVTSQPDSTIADVLSSNDFKKYVIEKEESKSTLKNSVYITKNGLEKVLLARQFLQKVKNGSVQLDQESLKNVKELFKEVSA